MTADTLPNNLGVWVAGTPLMYFCPVKGFAGLIRDILQGSGGQLCPWLESGLEFPLE